MPVKRRRQYEHGHGHVSNVQSLGGMYICVAECTYERNAFVLGVSVSC